jgi:hypothetical protein
MGADMSRQEGIPLVYRMIFGTGGLGSSPASEVSQLDVPFVRDLKRETGIPRFAEVTSADGQTKLFGVAADESESTLNQRGVLSQQQRDQLIDETDLERRKQLLIQWQLLDANTPITKIIVGSIRVNGRLLCPQAINSLEKMPWHERRHALVRMFGIQTEKQYRNLLILFAQWNQKLLEQMIEEFYATHHIHLLAEDRFFNLTITDNELSIELLLRNPRLQAIEGRKVLVVSSKGCVSRKVSYDSESDTFVMGNLEVSKLEKFNFVLQDALSIDKIPAAAERNFASFKAWASKLLGIEFETYTNGNSNFDSHVLDTQFCFILGDYGKYTPSHAHNLILNIIRTWKKEKYDVASARVRKNWIEPKQLCEMLLIEVFRSAQVNGQLEIDQAQFNSWHADYLAQAKSINPDWNLFADVGAAYAAINSVYKKYTQDFTMLMNLREKAQLSQDWLTKWSNIEELCGPGLSADLTSQLQEVIKLAQGRLIACMQERKAYLEQKGRPVSFVISPSRELELVDEVSGRREEFIKRHLNQNEEEASALEDLDEAEDVQECKHEVVARAWLPTHLLSRQLLFEEDARAEGGKHFLAGAETTEQERVTKALAYADEKEAGDLKETKLQKLTIDTVSRLGYELDAYIKSNGTRWGPFASKGRKINKERLYRVKLFRAVITAFEELLSHGDALTESDYAVFMKMLADAKGAHDKSTWFYNRWQGNRLGKRLEEVLPEKTINQVRQLKADSFSAEAAIVVARHLRNAGLTEIRPGLGEEIDPDDIELSPGDIAYLDVKPSHTPFENALAQRVPVQQSFLNKLDTLFTGMIEKLTKGDLNLRQYLDAHARIRARLDSQSTVVGHCEKWGFAANDPSLLQTLSKFDKALFSRWYDAFKEKHRVGMVGDSVDALVQLLDKKDAELGLSPSHWCGSGIGDLLFCKLESTQDLMRDTIFNELFFDKLLVIFQNKLPDCKTTESIDMLLNQYVDQLQGVAGRLLFGKHRDEKIARCKKELARAALREKVKRDHALFEHKDVVDPLLQQIDVSRCRVFSLLGYAKHLAVQSAEYPEPLNAYLSGQYTDVNKMVSLFPRMVFSRLGAGGIHDLSDDPYNKGLKSSLHLFDEDTFGRSSNDAGHEQMVVLDKIFEKIGRELDSWCNMVLDLRQSLNAPGFLRLYTSNDMDRRKKAFRYLSDQFRSLLPTPPQLLLDPPQKLSKESEVKYYGYVDALAILEVLPDQVVFNFFSNPASIHDSLQRYDLQHLHIYVQAIIMNKSIAECKMENAVMTNLFALLAAEQARRSDLQASHKLGFQSQELGLELRLQDEAIKFYEMGCMLIASGVAKSVIKQSLHQVVYPLYLLERSCRYAEDRRTIGDIDLTVQIYKEVSKLKRDYPQLAEFVDSRITSILEPHKIQQQYYLEVQQLSMQMAPIYFSGDQENLSNSKFDTLVRKIFTKIHREIRPLVEPLGKGDDKRAISNMVDLVKSESKYAQYYSAIESWFEKVCTDMGRKDDLYAEYQRRKPLEIGLGVAARQPVAEPRAVVSKGGKQGAVGLGLDRTFIATVGDEHRQGDPDPVPNGTEITVIASV